MLRRTPLTGLLALGVAATVVLAGNGLAAPMSSMPSPPPGSSGFYSVLAYGEGESTSYADLVANQATGAVPPSFTDQADLYNRVIVGQPAADAALLQYYKNSGFTVPTGAAVGSVETPTPGVIVIRDRAYQVPHIYASTRAGGMFGAGYATAEDRLFLMDVLRRTAEGTTADLLGPSALPGDSAALGQFDLSPAELTAEVMRLPEDEGAAGARALNDLQNYVAGIDAFIHETQLDPVKLPAEYVALGTLPQPWTLADTAAEAYLLIAQFTVAGAGQELQSDILTRLQAKLGPRRGAQVYADLRNVDNPDSPTTTSQRFPSDNPGPVNPRANARIDAGSITARNAVISTSPVPASIPISEPASFPAWARQLATHGLQLPHEASNALLVAADHSASGDALAAMGPQVGYYSPEILLEYELHAPGISVSGMSFPGASPYPLIGHGRDFAWTGTTALGDNADTFAERLCTLDGSAPTTSSDHYVYKGHCVAFSHRDLTETTPLAPTAPTVLPERVTLRTQRSAHGPVFGFATVAGAPVALVRSVAVIGHGVRSVVAFELLAENDVHSAQQFVTVMRHFTGNENWFYVSSRHIAWLASGWFQRHAPGTDLELPIWGTGPYDWIGYNPATHDFLRQPDSFNPTSIDPAQGYLASWNNKGAPGWHATPGTWSFGRVQRVQLLTGPVESAIRRGYKLTLAAVVGIAGNAATQDLRAIKVLPDLLAVLGPVSDPTQRVLLADLRSWLASGAHRRDTTGVGYYDSSAAVLAFDAWWRTVVHGVYDPIIGANLVALLYTDEDLVLDQRAVDSGFFDGWQSQLSAVLRKVEGVADPATPQGTYCGNGTMSSCRAVLRSALSAATALLEKANGANPAAWRMPVLCRSEATPTCDENRPVTAGAIATPSQPFENRGTFYQAVEIPAEQSSAGTLGGERRARPAGGLAVTGGGPLLPTVALSVLAAAVPLARRRHPR